MKQKVHVSKLGQGRSRGRVAMLLLLGAFLSPVFSGTSVAQATSTSYPLEETMWTGLEESASMVDVSFHVVKCQAADPSRVMLQVFNEGDLVNAIGFTLSITDEATQQSFNHTVASFPISIGTILTGECGSNANLVIDLPAGYDGSNLSLDITYN